MLMMQIHNKKTIGVPKMEVLTYGSCICKRMPHPKNSLIRYSRAILPVSKTLGDKCIFTLIFRGYVNLPEGFS